MILIIIHTPISRKWFQFNDCILIEGQYYLKADYSIKCFDDKWLAFSIPMILTGMIYIIGLPLGLLVWLVRHRTKLDEPEIKDSIGWMYMPYKRPCIFWEIEEIVRKMILSGGLIFWAKCHQYNYPLPCHYQFCSINYIHYGNQMQIRSYTMSNMLL